MDMHAAYLNFWTVRDFFFAFNHKQKSCIFKSNPKKKKKISPATDKKLILVRKQAIL